MATLRAEDIDWVDRTISYARQKTRNVSLIRFGESVATLKDSPRRLWGTTATPCITPKHGEPVSFRESAG
jgi:hypothetical protein